MNISARHIRFTTVVKYVSLVALAGHFLYIFLFLWVGTQDLALYNFYSCFLYLAAYGINEKGRPHLAIMLGAGEVIFHGYFASLSVGWNAGFHFYMLAFVPLIFYAPGWHLQLKFMLTAVLCAFYLILALYTQEAGPRIQTTLHQTKVMLGSNIVTMFLVTSAMAYFYRLASLGAEKELQLTNMKLKDLATTDSLTGLLNRRTMIELVEQESSRFDRTGAAFSMILVDIDDFKVVNDRHGHETGDRVLVEISILLRKALRSHDRVARWGGEEFLILLPATGLEMARLVAERLRVSIELNLATSAKGLVPVTITCGVNEYTDHADISECIRLADHALYQGKVQGKNCVVLAPANIVDKRPVSITPNRQ